MFSAQIQESGVCFVCVSLVVCQYIEVIVEVSGGKR